MLRSMKKLFGKLEQFKSFHVSNSKRFVLIESRVCAVGIDSKFDFYITAFKKFIHFRINYTSRKEANFSLPAISFRKGP